MNEIVDTLNAVDTGQYTGIGNQLIALGEEVCLPEGLTKPIRDKDLGWVGKYLIKTSLAASEEINLNIGSCTENGKIVDKRLLAWLLIGRIEPDGNPELCSEQFVFTAQDIVSKAMQTTARVASLKILQGGKKSATNWRSMFEGFVKADIFGKDFQPTIITSLGGFDGDVPLAAPFNIIPGLELGKTLRKQGYDPSFIVTSAAKYGVDCNGLRLEGASNNWGTTFSAYSKLIREFYPEADCSTTFETLVPSYAEGYPDKLIESAKSCCQSEESLRQTSEHYRAGSEAFVRYMLSHIQAFRDFQRKPETPFVMKVGAPSELRFLQWQKQVIEQALPTVDGFVPNMVLRNGITNQYGQISLYYPRLGNRPPYYPDAEVGEPNLYGTFPADYQDFLWSIAEDNPSLKRYADLELALKATSVMPNEYLALFSGANT